MSQPVYITDDMWAEVVRVMNKVNGLSGPGVINNPDGITITPPVIIPAAIQSVSEVKFLARVFGSVADVFLFHYAWAEVVMDGDETVDVVDGRSGTTTENYAINTAEINHTAVFQFGTDVTLTSYTDTAMVMMPIGGAGEDTTHRYDVVVEMTERVDANGATKYTFQLMGTHDGECS